MSFSTTEESASTILVSCKQTRFHIESPVYQEASFPPFLVLDFLVHVILVTPLFFALSFLFELSLTAPIAHFFPA
jgi:hypothetical protein